MIKLGEIADPDYVPPPETPEWLKKTEEYNLERSLLDLRNEFGVVAHKLIITAFLNAEKDLAFDVARAKREALEQKFEFLKMINGRFDAYLGDGNDYSDVRILFERVMTDLDKENSRTGPFIGAHIFEYNGEKYTIKDRMCRQWDD